MKIVALCILALVSLPSGAEVISPWMLESVLRIGDAAGVPRSVVRQLMIEESDGIPTARSHRTPEGYVSRGLFQLYEKPENLGDLLAKFWYGYDERGKFDIENPIHNSKVALRYLSALHCQFGSWLYALYFYNSGSIHRVPRETMEYAMRIINAP